MRDPMLMLSNENEVLRTENARLRKGLEVKHLIEENELLRGELAFVRKKHKVDLARARRRLEIRDAVLRLTARWIPLLLGAGILIGAAATSQLIDSLLRLARAN
jgi:hypothetical protein